MLRMKKLSYFVLIAYVVIWFSGCGETVRGVAQDSMRIGRGIKTIFISE